MFVKCTNHTLGDLNSLVRIYTQTYPHIHTCAGTCARIHGTSTDQRSVIHIDMAIYQYGD